MLNKNKNKFNSKLKKSHICLFGSLLIILGISIISYNHIMKLKINLFSDMQLSMEQENNIEEIIDSIPNALELSKEENPTTNNSQSNDTSSTSKPIDYSKYLGVLEIPRIGLKRGFYGTDSKYNNINYNVSVVG